VEKFKYLGTKVIDKIFTDEEIKPD